MNKKGITIGVLVVIILGVIIATRGGNKSTTQNPDEPVTEVSTTPGEYYNEEFGIAFSYPESWDYIEASYPVQNTLCLNYHPSTGDCSATVTVSWDSDLDTRFNGLKQVYSSFVVEESTYEILGKEGRLMEISGYRGEQGGNTRELMVEEDGKVYTIGILRGEEEHFDSIVESFEIIATGEATS